MNQKVYCCDCKHWHPMTVAPGFAMVSVEYCEANPRDTYSSPRSEYADPAFKNTLNDCKDFEAKE